jgi:ATP-dependent exoDNAse (exonuclease V) beta subunit
LAVSKRSAAAALSKEWDAEKTAARVLARRAEWEKIHESAPVISPSQYLKEPEKRPVIDDEAAVEIRPDAVTVGHVCHKVLEEWDFGGTAASLPKRLKSGVLRAGRLYDVVPGTESGDAVLKEAHSILTGFLESPAYKKLAQAKIVGREVPFFYPMNGDEGAVLMRGVIDLLYESGGELVVADYKTTRVEAGEGKETAKHYQRQGAAYQEAVRRALGRPARFDVIFLRTGEQVTFPQSA